MPRFLFQVIGKCFKDASRVKVNQHVDFLLEEDDWNDYNYITTYSIHATSKLSKRKSTLYLGDIRIMKIGQQKGERHLLRKLYEKDNLMFYQLPDDYVSLSLSLEFYENINRLLQPLAVRKAFISALNMILGPDSFMYERVWRDLCFTSSLLRDSSINDFALQQGRKLMLDEEILFDLRHESFSVSFPHTEETLNFNFCAIKEFSDSETIPNGIIAFIGKNGSGKSTALYEIAKILYASPDTRRLIADKVGRLGDNSIGISKLIMLSYSAFDNFILPGSTKLECEMMIEGLRDQKGRFVFCGIRDVCYDMNELYQTNRYSQDSDFLNEVCNPRLTNIRLKDSSELGKEFVKAMSSFDESAKARWNQFVTSVRACQIELWSAIRQISNPILYKERQVSSCYEQAFNNLSTGYKFIMHAMAHLIAHCDNNSLVLFDEPENHLQPPLLSFMISEIRKILAKTKSVMLIATHSPIILQEVFSKNVRIVRRYGNSRVFVQPSIETYGESFGAIASEVFKLNSDNTSYFQTIEMLYDVWNMDEKESLEQMIHEFESKLACSLSSQMEAFLVSKYSENHS